MYNEFKAKLLEDPETRREYEALDIIEIIEEAIEEEDNVLEE